LTHDEEYLLREMAMRCRTTCYRDRIQQVFLLRSARNPFEYVRIRRMVMDARASWKVEEQLRQRNWGSKVSRRPQRGNHHDSWAIREAYMRCKGDYMDHLRYAHKVQKRFGKFPAYAR
jgi:hypothetical protein